ncbi:MAG: PepSY-like domain-containing protein [Microscillaceae bacterium]|nr:PepSY-like domain-containing protein [Microscillaceae bacterium]
MKSTKQKKQLKKQGQEKLFPTFEVLAMFKDYFPDIDLAKVEWSWEVPYKIYEAEFEQDGQEIEAEFTITGHLVLIETSIPNDELPEVVRKSLRERYPNQSIDEVERVEYSNGMVCYEIELEKGEKVREVLYREDGLFIGEEIDL